MIIIDDTKDYLLKKVWKSFISIYREWKNTRNRRKKFYSSTENMQNWTARLIDVLGQRVQFCARFIDQW